jgi:hypothetical protein
MELPGRSDLQAFGAAAGQDRAVLELHGLVLDRPKDAFGQSSRLTPGLAVVLALAKEAPPADRIGADFVIKLQRTFLGLEQHRIPTGETLAIRLGAVGDHHGRRPLALDLTRRPDTDIRLAFGRAGEPSRDHGSVLRLDDRRRMTTRHGIRLEDESRPDQPRLGRYGGQGQAKEREQTRQGHAASKAESRAESRADLGAQLCPFVNNPTLPHLT